MDRLQVEYALRYMYGKRKRERIAREYREKYGDSLEREYAEMLGRGYGHVR